jgi:hypothetical protein
MKFQAEAQGADAKAALAAVLADPAKAQEEVLAFSKLNPPDKKYAKKVLIGWVQYLRKYSVKVSRTDSCGEKPYTKRSFQKY